MDRCDPRSRPLATNRAAHRAEKISAAYRNPRHRRQGIPGLRCRATPNTANLLSENRPGVTDAGVSLRRLTSRNSLTLKNFFQHGVEDGLYCVLFCFKRVLNLTLELDAHAIRDCRRISLINVVRSEEHTSELQSPMYLV